MRRLNPFRGVLQVVECRDGRAMSVDGVDWQIEVLGERPEHDWRSENRGEPRRQYFRFGRWHLRGGLSRVPVNPLLDIGSMTRAMDELVAALARLAPTTPYPLADTLEHWLFDATGEPLALIGSARPEASEVTDAAATGAPIAWRAAEATENKTPDGRLWLAELEALVMQRATDSNWCRSDGPASPGIAVPSARPPLGLTDNWCDPTARDRVHAYLDGLAPLLLMLPDLPEACRARLERAAARRAPWVDRYHRLYPVVLDTALIDTARIEARLRRARTSVCPAD